MNSPVTNLDFSGFDRLLEHRSRLLICLLLAAQPTLSFRELKQLLSETDGNLGAQLRKLETAGYLRVKKSFSERKPISHYKLTATGNAALSQHIETLYRLTEEFYTAAG